MFCTGASGLVSEYVLSTVSTYILGSSIEQFSITIAVMLGMMGVGGWAQKYIADSYLIEKFIGIEIFLALLGGFSPIMIYAAFGYLEHNFLFIYYFIVMFIGFLIGFEIPFIIRINEKYSNELKSNLSVVIAADYIGSFVGAIVWVYLLLPSFALTHIGFIVAGVNFFVAFLSFLYFMRFGLIRLRVLYFILIIGVAISMAVGVKWVDKWEVSIEQKFYEDRVITSKTTKYQHLTLTYNKALDEYRLYINGNVQFSSLDEVRYHEFLVHPAMSIAPKKKNILVLGGGDGLALKQIIKYQEVESITLVDLDPQMVQFAKTNPILSKLNNHIFDNATIHTSFPNLSTKEVRSLYSDDNKTKWLTKIDVVNIDADIFLKDIKKKQFDVVIIDFPDPSSIELAKLYSKQFYQKLSYSLSQDGIIAIQSTSPYHAKEAFLSIGRTLRASGYNTLAYQHNTPSFGQWGWYLASQSSIARSPKEFGVDTEYITPALFKASKVFGKNELYSKDTSINTLMNPTLYHIYSRNSWQNY